jgi:hypothetical protein
MHNENYLKWFDKHGKERPSHVPHGTEEDIRKNMVKLMPTKWVQQGNQLIGTTEDGVRIVQSIPTDHLLSGTDDRGLPTFTKI